MRTARKYGALLRIYSRRRGSGHLQSPDRRKERREKKNYADTVSQVVPEDSRVPRRFNAENRDRDRAERIARSPVNFREDFANGRGGGRVKYMTEIHGT